MKVVVKNEMRAFRVFLLITSLLLLLVVYPYLYLVDSYELKSFILSEIPVVCVIILQLRVIK